MSDDIKHHISVYKKVFLGLLILTFLTVAAAYVEFDKMWVTLLVGLFIAGVKGYLVAANFMHLNNEKKFIYGILLLTVSFFFVLLFMPLLWDSNSMDLKDKNGAFDKEVEEIHDDSHHSHH